MTRPTCIGSSTPHLRQPGNSSHYRRGAAGTIARRGGIYSAPMAEWPLHGRDAEVAHLSELLDDPASRGVVVSGVQGVGKTRLGIECLRLAAERGCAVERISATYATSSLPLGALILPRPPQDTSVSS